MSLCSSSNPKKGKDFWLSSTLSISMYGRKTFNSSSLTHISILCRGLKYIPRIISVHFAYPFKSKVPVFIYAFTLQI
nr:MAG TPA: hypothetical protein [Caudoviricetes sp.]